MNARNSLACILVLSSCGPETIATNDRRVLPQEVCIQLPANQASDDAMLALFGSFHERFGGEVLNQRQATYYIDPDNEVNLHYYKTMHAYGRILFGYGAGVDRLGLVPELRIIEGAEECRPGIESSISG